jgi:hypothetical protein
MDVIKVGKLMDVRLVQPENARLPMVVKELPTSMVLSSDQFSNALAPIVPISSGRITSTTFAAGGDCSHNDTFLFVKPLSTKARR